MGAVHRLPGRGDVFADVRGERRAMRVTHHVDAGVIVISFWHGERCTGTFRMPLADAGRLIALLAGELTARLAAGEQGGTEQVTPRAADPTR